MQNTPAMNCEVAGIGGPECSDEAVDWRNWRQNIKDQEIRKPAERIQSVTRQTVANRT